MYNNTIHYLIRLKQLYPRNFFNYLTFPTFIFNYLKFWSCSIFLKNPRTDQNESSSIEQFVQIFGKRAWFRSKVVPHPPPSHSFSRIGSNEACVAGEYDLRRDSFERIEKQPAKDDRAERRRIRAMKRR